MNTASGTTLTLTLFCLSLLTAGYAATPKGAAVQNYTIDINDNKIKFTVLNQSDKDITEFAIAVESTMPDGGVERTLQVKTYGPLSGRILRSHAAVEEDFYETPLPLSVNAKIVAVIYSDGTAEAESKATLDILVIERAAQAKTRRISAGILNAALADEHPAEFSRARLARKLAESDHTVDNSLLQELLRSVAAVSGKEDEQPFLRAEAARYAKEAAAYEAFAKVGQQ